jgi:hypothetical protein
VAFVKEEEEAKDMRVPKFDLNLINSFESKKIFLKIKN